MYIPIINFPLYILCILLSYVCSVIFQYKFLSKNNVEKQYIYLYLLLFSILSLFGGILFSSAERIGNEYSFSIGLSSYGGFFGGLFSAYFFSKLTKNKNSIFIKSSLLSLPLMYGVAKLGCLFAGCCHGIHYYGPLNIKYEIHHGESFFPIQLLESISFLILFAILMFFNKKKNISYVIIILSALLKFLLDFLRISHVGVILSLNQVISLVLIVVTLILMVCRRNSTSK